eukprot:TRINITY_DN10984_c0_g1_i1.p1 TRINITY_DN10984_c0_g1~~TRINITY_DN10984_c0_g1_i1.p1  ORF type:complete len:414 (+),score=92.40 TRINITY_DN10984_c0_g1_i1:56-1243(+)
MRWPVVAPLLLAAAAAQNATASPQSTSDDSSTRQIVAGSIVAVLAIIGLTGYCLYVRREKDVTPPHPEPAQGKRSPTAVSSDHSPLLTRRSVETTASVVLTLAACAVQKTVRRRVLDGHLHAKYAGRARYDGPTAPSAASSRWLSTLPPGFRVGDRVVARKGRSTGALVAATITQLNPDGTCAVQFDDGDFDFREPVGWIRPAGRFGVGDRVLARWRDTDRWDQGCIASLNAGGTYVVQFDDGDVEAFQAESNMRSLVGLNVGLRVAARRGGPQEAATPATIVDHAGGMVVVRFDGDGAELRVPEEWTLPLDDDVASLSCSRSTQGPRSPTTPPSFPPRRGRRTTFARHTAASNSGSAELFGIHDVAPPLPLVGPAVHKPVRAPPEDYTAVFGAV